MKSVKRGNKEEKKKNGLKNEKTTHESTHECLFQSNHEYAIYHHPWQTLVKKTHVETKFATIGYYKFYRNSNELQNKVGTKVS